MNELDPKDIAKRVAAAQSVINLGLTVYRHLPANGQRNVRRVIVIASAGGATFALLRHLYRSNEAFRAQVDELVAKGNTMAMLVAARTMGFITRVMLATGAARSAWSDPEMMSAVLVAFHGDNDGGQHTADKAVQD